jgi:hypothetical protein
MQRQRLIRGSPEGLMGVINGWGQSRVLNSFGYFPFLANDTCYRFITCLLGVVRRIGLTIYPFLPTVVTEVFFLPHLSLSLSKINIIKK